MASYNNRNIKKKKTVNTNTQKTFAIICATIAIAIIIFVFSQKKNNENYNNIKQDKNNYIVYTKYQDRSTEYPKDIPYVNLKAEVFEEVNKDIYSFCQGYMNSKKSVITYEYDINGIILSLVVKVINNEVSYAPEPYFRTYNINLETEEVIANDALLQFFNVTNSTVENKIKRQLQSYYKDIVKAKYYTSAECSYDCFLKWRGINKYTDYVSYYVRDGKLIAYKTFIAHSIFGEEEYFDDTHFEFEIADAPASQQSEDKVPLSRN